MSCMEHTCTTCGEMYFNNESSSPQVCEKCRGVIFFRQWDEQADYDRMCHEREVEQEGK